jgi:O-antigen ligase
MRSSEAPPAPIREEVRQSRSTGFASTSGYRRVAGPRVQRQAVRVHLLLSWAFWVFVFSIPFETIDIGLGGQDVSLSKLFGYLFIMATLLQPQASFRSFPHVFWCFALYLTAFFSLGLLIDSQYQGLVLGRMFQLVQMVFLFWTSYNLMRDDRVVRGMLLSLAVSCSLLALVVATGFAASKVEVFTGGERVSALAENANTVGAVLSLGLLSLIGLAYGREKVVPKARLFAIPLFCLMGVQVIQTGSRGALVALLMGMMVLVLKGGSTWIRVRNMLIVLLALGFFTVITVQTETFRVRWEKTAEGSLAGREKIFPMAWGMFLEKPLTGWGPEKHTYVLGRRMGANSKDPHNLYFWLLNEVGLLGAVPYFMALMLCLHAAWKARRGAQGVLPLALMLVVLVVNMTGNFQNRKLHWIVLAYVLVSGNHYAGRRLRRTAVGESAPTDRRPATVG